MAKGLAIRDLEASPFGWGNSTLWQPANTIIAAPSPTL
jgi:hypothetical protein